MTTETAKTIPTNPGVSKQELFGALDWLVHLAGTGDADAIGIGTHSSNHMALFYVTSLSRQGNSSMTTETDTAAATLRLLEEKHDQFVTKQANLAKERKRVNYDAEMGDLKARKRPTTLLPKQQGRPPSWPTSPTPFWKPKQGSTSAVPPSRWPMTATSPSRNANS